MRDSCGTPNVNSNITECVKVEVEIGGHKEDIKAVVQLEDRTDIIMGHDWLIKHNPEINWNNGTIHFTQCPLDCTTPHQEITCLPKIR